MLKKLLLLAALAASLVAHAQSVRWEPGSGTLAFNQISELSLVFDQCEPSGAVTLPDIPGLSVAGNPSRSENTAFNIINGRASHTRTVTLVYRVRPTERLRVTIPAFQIDTDKGRQLVRSASFDIGDATVGQSGLSLDSVVQSRLAPGSASVWAGEIFPLTYTLTATRRYLYQIASDPEWNAAPLAVEPWAKPEQHETVVNDDPRVSILYRTRASAKAPGDVTLNSVTQLVNLATGNSGFSIFSRPSLEQRIITSPPSRLVVKPLPSPAPAGFTGAVGRFTLDSQVVPAKASVGEPITWTLTLDGTGNWPDIAGLPPRSVSRDFRIVQPQAKRTNKDNSLFDVTLSEDVVLIPAKPGTYTLGPVSLPVFNPSTGAYETLATQPVTITVTPAAQTASPPASPESPPPASSPSDAGHSPLAMGHSGGPAAAPLPGDPLPPAGSSFAPLSVRALVLCLLASVLFPLAVWLLHALRRARATDPARPLREARIRLSDTLRGLAALQPEAGSLKPEAPASAPQTSGLSPQVSDFNPQLSQLLRSWQRDTAILFQIGQAVPTPASFRAPALDRSGDTAAWPALWADAERALYGGVPLPGDWISRASAALAARRLPAFSAFQLFLPRNLLPLVLVLSSFALGPSSFGAEGAESYARADFAAAEKAWRDTLAAAPRDASARHNLSLALVQQDRAAEAAAHALAAFVQRPRDEAVRRQLDYAFQAASLAPPPVAQRATLDARLAALASPARWQAALIAAAWLSAAALALKLHSLYRQRPAPRHWSFVIGHASFRRVLAAAALLLAVAGGVGLHAYGPLADARAVVVAAPSTLRSIPTDLDTQKTSPLRAGALARAEKTFLGWTQLSFADGRTGWTRTETLVPLWE